MATVHVSPFSGSWYPGTAAELDRLIAACFEESRRRTGPFLPRAHAFIVPHAGLAYSGTVAAAAYRDIEQLRPERVIVLGFPHHGGLQGIAAPDVESIATPLGDVAVETNVPGVRRVVEARLCDHSFE